MASGLKRVAEVLLARGGPASLADRRTRPSTAILAYHNIVPHGEKAVGDRSLHVDQATFGHQLDFLLERADIVPLEAALAEGPGGEDRPRVVVTFDDAYRGTMTAGVEELAARGLPATIFVPPGLLGADGFWWDRLAPEDRPLADTVRDHALSEAAGDGERVLEWARREGLAVRSMPEHARPETEARLLDPALPPGITYGAHTWSHPNLSALAPGEIATELSRAKSWLSARSDRYVDWLAYPYGLRNAAVVSAAAATHRGALLVTGGLARRADTTTGGAHEVPRINVPRGLSHDGLQLRLTGLLPR